MEYSHRLVPPPRLRPDLCVLWGMRRGGNLWGHHSKGVKMTMLKMDACDLVSFVLDLRTCHVNMNKRLTSFCARYVCTCVHVRVCWSQMRAMQVLLSHGSCGSCSLSHQHVEHFDRQDRLDRLHSMCDGRVDCLSGRAGRTVPDHVLPALCVANVSCDATTVRRRQCSVFHRRIDQHHRHCVVYPVLQVYAGL